MRLSLVLTVVGKDWIEFRKPIATLTVGLILPVLMPWAGIDRPDFADGLIAGGLIVGPYLFTELCLSRERQSESFGLLLSLPATRGERLLSKYASVYSMTLVSVNPPGILLRDPAFAFCANATGLFFATVFITATVISCKPRVPIFPFVILGLIVAPALLLRPDLVGWIDEHKSYLAFVGYALIPLMVIASVFFFENKKNNPVP